MRKQKSTKESREDGRRVSAPQPEASATVKSGFAVNPFYERLLEMREVKPAAYKSLSAATRFAVEAYVKAKEAAIPTQTGKVAA